MAARVECLAAIARCERDASLSATVADDARAVVGTLAVGWFEVEPTEECRERAALLVRRYPLRTADAFQLAAALVWAQGRPRGHVVCTFDARLAFAARSEGFELLFSAA